MGKTKKVYRFRDGSRLSNAKAPAVGRELERIQREKRRKAIKATDVVEAASDPENPLHEFFEWDDGKAAEHYRLDQARQLLRSIEVTYEELGSEKQAPMRLFINLRPTGEDEAAYVPTVAVLGDAEMRQQAIARALAEAESWRRRHEHLNELAAIFDAIQEARTTARDEKAA